MIRGLEFAGFVALAAAVHAGIWSAAPQGGGAGGENGEETVTLAAAAPQMAALVAAWERPVAHTDRAPTPPATPPAEPEPAALRPEAAPPRPIAAPGALPRTGPAPKRPRIEAAPLPLPAPQLSDRAPQPAAGAPAEPTPRLPGPSAAAPRTAPPPTAPRASRLAALPQIEHGSATPRPARTRPLARPAETAAPPAPARRKETARGSGGQDQAGGMARTEAPATIDTAARASLMGQWGGAIRARIERQKRYPSGTRAQGTVHLVLDVGGDGRLLAVGLQRSSGDARLDAAAMTAVRRARLPAKPDALPGARHRFNLPMAFAR